MSRDGALAELGDKGASRGDNGSLGWDRPNLRPLKESEGMGHRRPVRPEYKVIRTAYTIIPLLCNLRRNPRSAIFETCLFLSLIPANPALDIPTCGTQTPLKPPLIEISSVSFMQAAVSACPIHPPPDLVTRRISIPHPTMCHHSKPKTAVCRRLCRHAWRFEYTWESRDLDPNTRTCKPS